jgi:hypothetical protein
VGRRKPIRVGVYRDAKGQWRWRARARNNRIVADSAEGYHNRSDCWHQARTLFPDAEVSLWSDEKAEAEKGTGGDT